MKTFISVFFFAVVSFYFQPVMAAPPITIATGWGAMTGSVGIAQAKGFFKEQGIKTTTLSMAGDKQIFQAYMQEYLFIPSHR
jgi:ABC-type nitrate/sulfonate/bicarbonate transport system substrate-binding protein